MSGRVNIYSILIRNNLKIPDINDNDMFLRGYLEYFLTNILSKEEGKIVKEILLAYSDDQWRKLFIRLRKHGHILE